MPSNKRLTFKLPVFNGRMFTGNVDVKKIKTKAISFKQLIYLGIIIANINQIRVCRRILWNLKKKNSCFHAFCLQAKNKSLTMINTSSSLKIEAMPLNRCIFYTYCQNYSAVIKISDFINKPFI